MVCTLLSANIDPNDYEDDMTNISRIDITPPSLKLLTEHEVVTLIRKSVHWLRRKRWEGGEDSIPYRKLGASVRYDEADVLSYIQRHALRIFTSEKGGINE